MMAQRQGRRNPKRPPVNHEGGKAEFSAALGELDEQIEPKRTGHDAD